MPMRIGTPMPALDGATEWRNGVPSAAGTGRVTLVHFWAVSCHSCSDLMPKVIEWRDTLGPRGLTVVGVHMPRYEADTQLEPVYQAIEKYGLTHPIAVDNLHKLAEAFSNEFVPAFYVFDQEGKLRGFAAGENAAKMIQGPLERAITALEEAS